MTTQAPKTLFWAKKWLFVAIFGQKMCFFVMAALKPLIICSKPCKTHFSEFSNLQNMVWDPTTDHSGPKNTVLG